MGQPIRSESDGAPVTSGKERHRFADRLHNQAGEPDLKFLVFYVFRHPKSEVQIVSGYKFPGVLFYLIDLQ